MHTHTHIYIYIYTYIWGRRTEAFAGEAGAYMAIYICININIYMHALALIQTKLESCVHIRSICNSQKLM